MTTGPGPARSAKRRGGEPEHPAGPLEPGDHRRGPLAPLRRLDQLAPRPPRCRRASRRSSGRPAPTPVVSASAASARLARSTACSGPTTAMPFGQRVEGRLPLLLAAPDDLVQPAVGQHDRGVGGHGGEQPEVLGGERAALPVGHGERAHRDALRAERRHRRRAHDRARRSGPPRGRRRPGPPRSARAGWRSARARVSGSSLTCPMQRLERARRRRPPGARRPLLVVGQHDDGAVGLEEAAGVLARPGPRCGRAGSTPTGRSSAPAARRAR